MNQIGPKSGKIAKNNQRKTTKQANFRVNKATFFLFISFNSLFPLGVYTKGRWGCLSKENRTPKIWKWQNPLNLRDTAK